MASILFDDSVCCFTGNRERRLFDLFVSMRRVSAREGGSMRFFNWHLSVLVLCLVALPAHSQLEVFDDFNEGLIDPAKWSAINQTQNSLNQSRKLSAGALVLRSRSWAPTSNARSDVLGLSIAPATARKVTGLSAEVSITGMRQKRCRQSNVESAKSFVALGGHWFKTGRSASRRGSNGDIVADIVIGRGFGQRLSGNKLEIFARIFVCRNNNCTRTQRLFEKKLSNARLKRTYQLAVQHYPDSKRFRFSAGEQRKWYSYDQLDLVRTQIRGATTHNIALVNDVPNCRNIARTSSVETTAIINWVKVNADALR